MISSRKGKTSTSSSLQRGASRNKLRWDMVKGGEKEGCRNLASIFFGAKNLGMEKKKDDQIEGKMPSRPQKKAPLGRKRAKKLNFKKGRNRVR